MRGDAGGTGGGQQPTMGLGGLGQGAGESHSPVRLKRVLRMWKRFMSSRWMNLLG